MAGGSESRRSMASASVAAHRAEANVADARLARYNDRIGRVRKERAVWPGAAFIVEALLLLVFLTGSLAVLMNLNAEADRIGHESADLMDGLVLASNVAEEFAADPIAFKEAYEADPMCGFKPSIGLAREMLLGIRMIQQKDNLVKMPKELPVLFFAGAHDPVGASGKGVLRSEAEFKKAGMRDVSCRIYPDGRHEMLNESNKLEVFDDVLRWMESKL